MVLGLWLVGFKDFYTHEARVGLGKKTNWQTCVCRLTWATARLGERMRKCSVEAPTDTGAHTILEAQVTVGRWSVVGSQRSVGQWSVVSSHTHNGTRREVLRILESQGVKSFESSNHNTGGQLSVLNGQLVCGRWSVVPLGGTGGQLLVVGGRLVRGLWSEHTLDGTGFEVLRILWTAHAKASVESFGSTGDVGET